MDQKLDLKAPKSGCVIVSDSAAGERFGYFCSEIKSTTVVRTFTHSQTTKHTSVSKSREPSSIPLGTEYSDVPCRKKNAKKGP
jgi:hypothetical protein